MPDIDKIVAGILALYDAIEMLIDQIPREQLTDEKRQQIRERRDRANAKADALAPAGEA